MDDNNNNAKITSKRDSMLVLGVLEKTDEYTMRRVNVGEKLVSFLLILGLIFYFISEFNHKSENIMFTIVSLVSTILSLCSAPYLIYSRNVSLMVLKKLMVEREV